MTPTFVHLHCHTEFSLVDGIVRIKPLMQQLRTQGMSAVAMTDCGNLFAAVKFYQAAISAGIKPIFGAELNLQGAELVVLCQDDVGYRNLTQLLSLGYLEGQQQGRPSISREQLFKHHQGLIVLSNYRSDIGQLLLNDQKSEAQALLKTYQQQFGDRFYLSLSRTDQSQEAVFLPAAVALAEKHQIPVVATNDVRFLKPDDFDAHEARVCIQEGFILDDERRPRNYTPAQFCRSPEAMVQLFADIPEAIANTVEIAKRCSVPLDLGKAYLPDFPVPEGQTVEEFLVAQSHAGLQQRLKTLKVDDPTVYQQRLDHELDVINNMGYPGYFLIVADFIQWAKDNDVPVGPGRGSGAGSLVAYVLGITDLDPLEYDLLFERFLNPERVSMPDFDVDFCMEGRDRVIDYVAQKYGRDSVSQIITFGTMAAKAVVRDVGRVLGFPYGFVDSIAKLIPFEIGMTLEKALEEDDLKARYRSEDDVRQLIDLAKKLEGIARNAGKHAGGVVIAPTTLTDFTPLYCEAKTQSVTSQFDKDDVEAVGLVKFDFLGLRNLTIIKWALKTIEKTYGKTIDINHIPLDDEKSYALLKSTHTTAVFQLESRGMKDLIKRLQPDCFEEIIALVALFRPGPLQSGMVDDFIDRKHGRAVVEYPHPDLEPILKPTYGVILYQEQVMQIAQVLAGYTLGAADMLRRAMGKKKPAEMAKQRDIFVTGATERGVEPKVATYIFDLMEKFAGYGFNKSHSAAYALLAYQTAWLKVHYKAAFMAAVLSSDMDNTDKVVAFLNDCKTIKLSVLAPDINQGQYAFTVNKEDAIVYGLGAVKGVGQAVVETIVVEREAEGPFTDLFNLCQRLDLRKVGRKPLELLIYAGALDQLGPDRATLLASLDLALSAAEQQQSRAQSGQQDLFAMDSSIEALPGPDFIAADSWLSAKKLSHEKQVLGYYLSGHPVASYRQELQHFVSCDLSHVQQLREGNVVIAGLVVGLRTVTTKRGNRMGILTLEDEQERIEVTLFPEAFQQFKPLLEKDTLVVITGEVNFDNFTERNRISAETVLTWVQARGRFSDGLLVRCSSALEPAMVGQLKALLSNYLGGDCPVWIKYLHNNAEASMRLDAKWQVCPEDGLLEQLSQLCGEDSAKLVYNMG